MLSLGARAVDAPNHSFYVEFKPISRQSVPDALGVSWFDLEQLAADGREPMGAMLAFQSWAKNTAAGKKLVFIGFNAAYDWQFVNWYFETYCGRNPFGFGAVDIKSYFMGLTGSPWSASTSRKLRTKFQPDTPQTHNALEDAKAQASIFAKLVEAALAKSR